MMEAREIIRRYQNGQQNFSGENLVGQSFKECNSIDGRIKKLSQVDFSNADIRGASFSGVTLEGVDFSNVRAGISQQRATVLWVSVALLLFFSSVCLGWSSVLIRLIFEAEKQTQLIGLGSLIIVVTFLIGLISQGLMAGLRYLAFASIAAIVLAGFQIVDGTIIGATIIAGAITILGVLLGSFAMASGIILADNLDAKVIFKIIPFYILFSILSLGLFTIPKPFTLSVTLSLVLSSTYIGCQVFFGRKKFTLIRAAAVNFSSWGGTNFSNATLIKCSFAGAHLKSSDFRKATLIRTNLYEVRELGYSRLGETILENPKVRNLLVCRGGKGGDYKGCDLKGAYLKKAFLSNANFTGSNLKGAYLVEADLSNSNFTEADISQADLSGAQLDGANLAKTQALGTCFYQTVLTGATLEAWNIDHTTDLIGAICDYVYLLQNHQDPLPNSGSFAPGDFTKLFQKVINTIDLIFHNGVDWKALTQTLNQIQAEYAGDNIAIQAIENKGDGVVIVKLNAAPGADKPAIHESFAEIYKLALKQTEVLYKQQLNAKNSEIEIYRQQNADLQENVRSLAERPVKIVQGDDNSQHNQYGDNANVVNQYGAGNTANLDLPPLVPDEE